VTPRKRNKRHLSALMRRAKFLAERISANEGRDLSYDKAELSALNDAIARMKGLEGEDSVTNNHRTAHSGTR
jgi:hypothetical protein